MTETQSLVTMLYCYQPSVARLASGLLLQHLLECLDKHGIRPAPAAPVGMPGQTWHQACSCSTCRNAWTNVAGSCAPDSWTLPAIVKLGTPLTPPALEAMASRTAARPLLGSARYSAAPSSPAFSAAAKSTALSLMNFSCHTRAERNIHSVQQSQVQKKKESEHSKFRSATPSNPQHWDPTVCIVSPVRSSC